MEVEQIEHENKILAIIIRKEVQIEGVEFFTSEDCPLQLGVSVYKKGMEIKPHIHVSMLRQINSQIEVLHIEKGEAEANFFSDTGKSVETRILREGDTVLLMCGHGLKALEDARIIEVKQGPYFGKKTEKRYLT